MRMTRRAFLRGAGAVAGVGLGSAALAACRSQARRGAGVPLVRRDHPVAWPIHADNPPLPSGLPVERGATLRVFEWRQYLSPDVLHGFTDRFRVADVAIHVESFDSRQQALARIQEPDARFDVFFPTLDQIGGLVRARLIRPLTHEYLPNVRHLWPAFAPPADPFYDRELRYTVPYTVFSTGIGFRTDLVARGDAPGRRANPYDLFWDPRYRGRIGLYDDYREALGMALLRDGSRDVNTTERSALDRAARALDAMAAAVDVRLTTEGAYEGLPEGRFAAHQAWSGDMLSALRWGRATALGTAPLLEFWWPGGHEAVVGCDLVAVCSGGRSPVLAHAFLNHLLDPAVALSNFAWNGYQPPVADAVPDALFARGSSWRRSVPHHLRGAVMTPQQFEDGQFLLGLDPAGDAEWLRAWDGFRSRL